MIQHIRRYYIVLISLSLLACGFSYYRSGISSPGFPALLTPTLEALTSVDPPQSSKSIQLDAESSDRKLSPATQYIFPDGSRLYAVMIRVRKRDDFKIETYGLLTKGIDQIYIRSPLFNSSIPYSMIGLIKGVETLQTCVIPGTTDLDQVNVQLFPLLSQADRRAGSTQSLLSKFLGTDDRSDYSCLVLTFQPKSIKAGQSAWRAIIQAAQLSMVSPKNAL